MFHRKLVTAVSVPTSIMVVAECGARS